MTSLIKKVDNSYSSSDDYHPRQKSLNGSHKIFRGLPITQWSVSTATMLEMMSRPNGSNWLVRHPFIKGQVSLAVQQDSLLTQDMLASQRNFCSMSDLTDASGTPNSIEEDPGRSTPAFRRPYSFPECNCALGPTSVRYQWNALKEGRDSGNIP